MSWLAPKVVCGFAAGRYFPWTRLFRYCPFLLIVSIGGYGTYVLILSPLDGYHKATDRYKSQGSDAPSFHFSIRRRRTMARPFLIWIWGLLYRTTVYIEISNRMLVISRALCRPPTPIDHTSKIRRDFFSRQKIRAESSASVLNKRYRYSFVICQEQYMLCVRFYILVG